MLQGTNKMSFLKLVNLTKIIGITFGIVFLISGVLINIMQFFLHVFVKPYSKYVFRKLYYYLSYSLCSQIVFLEQYWSNMKVHLHAKESDFGFFAKEQALLLMNHSYEIDWMIGWVLCDVFRMLGDVQMFAKKSLQYIPTVGFNWKIGGSVFLERDWQKDEKTFITKLGELMEYEDPFWIMMAAEGTRYTKEKHDACKAFAKQNGLPELRYHLTPRTKGFTTTVPLVRNNIPAIYNVNVAVKQDGVKPTLTNILLGKSIRADVYVERIPMKDLPENEADLAAWLHTLYKRKDDLLHSYFQTGHWKALDNPRPYISYSLPRRIIPLVNFACWSAAVLLPLGSFLIGLIMSGSLLNLATVVGIIGTLVYFLDKLVGETKVSNASSYGTSQKTFLRHTDAKTSTKILRSNHS